VNGTFPYFLVTTQTNLMTDDLWYKDGLRFECLQCGSCCSGFSGTVRVSKQEIATLAKRFGLPEDEFRKNYTRIVGGGVISLVEKKTWNASSSTKHRDAQCTLTAPDNAGHGRSGGQMSIHLRVGRVGPRDAQG
jgi:hypothetical protein